MEGPPRTENLKVKRSILKFYKWVLTCWVNQGGDWTLKRLSNLSAWCLYYCVESEYSQPEVLSGTYGMSRDGFLDFNHFNGGNLEALVPTRGPRMVSPHEKTNFYLYELYSAKGGLPGPSDETVLSAFRKHRETLLSRGETHEVILNAAERFARKYHDKFKPLPSAVHITVGNSAVLENTRSKGGRGAWIMEQLEQVKMFDPIEIPGYQGPLYDAFGEYLRGYPTPGSLCLEDLYSEVRTIDGGEGLDAMMDSSKARARALEYRCYEEAHKSGFLPGVNGEPLWGSGYMGIYSSPPEILTTDFRSKPYLVRASAVKEQGNKARIITISPGSLATILHNARTYCFSSLRKDPEVGSLSEDGTLNSYLKRVNKYLQENPDEDLSDQVLVSLDLTRATDTFHLDICQRFSRGYLGHPSTPLKVRILQDLAASPVSLEYPLNDFELNGESISERGILMGNPSSWFFLCLFTRFFWELSGYLTRVLRNYNKVYRNGKLTKKALESIDAFLNTDDSKISSGDPKTGRCGDDQISLCKKLRGLLFEKLLSEGGGIISPGVHFRSEKWGIYCKSLLRLDKTKRKMDFEDILRSRLLSTPDARLPGKKENPPEWSRGSASSKELAWWQGDEFRDSVYQSASTFVHWRYADFLKKARFMGLEIYLPQAFGGLEYPHHQRKIILQGKTKRMLSILLRNDISIEHLLESNKLGKLWSSTTHSPLGVKVEGTIKDFLSWQESKSIFGFHFDDLEPPEFPKWWTLQPYIDRIKKEHPGWKTLDEVMDLLQGPLYASLAYKYPSGSISKNPSLREISKMFIKIRDQILDSDSHKYQQFKITSFSDIKKRSDWKWKSVLISDENLDLIPTLTSN